MPHELQRLRVPKPVPLLARRTILRGCPLIGKKIKRRMARSSKAVVIVVVVIVFVKRGATGQRYEVEQAVSLFAPGTSSDATTCGGAWCLSVYRHRSLFALFPISPLPISFFILVVAFGR